MVVVEAVDQFFQNGVSVRQAGRRFQAGAELIPSGVPSHADNELEDRVVVLQGHPEGTQKGNGGRAFFVGYGWCSSLRGRLKPRQQRHKTCLRRLRSESTQVDFVNSLARFQPPGIEPISCSVQLGEQRGPSAVQTSGSRHRRRAVFSRSQA